MRSAMSAALVFLLPGLLWADGEGDAKADEQQIQDLIDDLDSDKFDTRQEAVEKLTKTGIPAIGALKKACVGTTVETRFRAISILGTMFKSEDAATKKAAHAALIELSKSESGGTARLAKKLIDTPQYELPVGIWSGKGSAPVFGGVRKIAMTGAPGGVSITGAGITMGTRGQLILSSMNGGQRRVDILKGTGQGMLLLEGENGIEIHTREPTDDPEKPKFTRYQAKDEDELAKKHAKIHELYKKLDEYKKNGTIIGGVQLDF